MSRSEPSSAGDYSGGLPESYEDVLELLRAAEELEWQAALLRSSTPAGSTIAHRDYPEKVLLVRRVRGRIRTLIGVELLAFGILGIGVFLRSLDGFGGWQSWAVVFGAACALAGIGVLSGVGDRTVLSEAEDARVRAIDKEIAYRLDLAHRLVRPLQEFVDVIADQQEWSIQRRDMIYARLSRFSLDSPGKERREKRR